MANHVKKINLYVAAECGICTADTFSFVPETTSRSPDTVRAYTYSACVIFRYMLITYPNFVDYVNALMYK